MSDKKRTASKDHVCPCKNCKSECTQSIKIVKRHLEVFGRYSGDHDNQLSSLGFGRGSKVTCRGSRVQSRGFLENKK